MADLAAKVVTAPKEVVDPCGVRVTLSFSAAASGLRSEGQRTPTSTPTLIGAGSKNGGNPKALNYIHQLYMGKNLHDTIKWLLESSEQFCHLDRHVTPSAEESPIVACEAGLALLLEWADVARNAGAPGIFISAPLLMIDDEWLEGIPNAPPPHVLISLAKTGVGLDKQPLYGSGLNRNDSPFSRLLVGELSNAVVYRIEPNQDFPDHGAWLVTLPGTRDVVRGLNST